LQIKREIKKIHTFIITYTYAYIYNPITGGHNWATLFLGEINTGTWTSMLKNKDNELWS
jgi:hypothetical protein